MKSMIPTKLAFLTAVLLILDHGAGPKAQADQPADPAGALRHKFLSAFHKRASLTQAEVLGLLGKPQRKTRQILYKRYLEQWIYEPPLRMCVKFAWPGFRVLSVH